ncbi:MAG: MBOAT family protein [Lentisphaerae bacterium]|nr:MBOAT family protein [Lentisphaerota bacterium]
MLFNSFEFILLYLPVVLGGYFLLGQSRSRLPNLWLALASVFFYGWWNVAFVPLLLGSITFNYAMGYWIGKTRDGTGGKVLLVVGISANLALLGYFKYANFILTTVNGLAGSEFAALAIVLPLGISFFTFTQIAYLVDVRRLGGQEYNFIDYVLFVTYFPHLIAGPVLHHKQIMPQFADLLTRPRAVRINSANSAFGLTLFAMGLFKKVVLADGFATFAVPVFNSAHEGTQPQLVVAWLGALAYAFQIYFDFSGYSDMAVGLSRLFGVRLPVNFESPYQATNMIDFWKRWHMTLSQFLKDYLYIPLGGNRKGPTRRYMNLLVTMLLGGLWHGANWTFVAWGGLHGLYLVVAHGWRAFAKEAAPGSSGWGPIGHIASTAFTFVLVVIAWVFFRAADLETACRILRGMFDPGFKTSTSLYVSLGLGHHLVTLRQLALFVAGALLVWFVPASHVVAEALVAGERGAGRGFVSAAMAVPRICWAVVFGLALGVSLMQLNQISEFLYFQF